MGRNFAAISVLWVAGGILSCAPSPADSPGAPAPHDAAPNVTAPGGTSPAVTAPKGGTKLSLRGVKPLNENERGESTPVTIRIFLLKDGARFAQATVEEVWIRSKELLGDDFVGMKEVVILPGTAGDAAQQIELGDSPASVRSIGVLALFPKEDDQGPRKLVLGRSELGSRLQLTGYHLVREK